MANDVNQKHRIPVTIKISNGPRILDRGVIVFEMWLKNETWEQGFQSPALDAVNVFRHFGEPMPPTPLLDSYVKALCAAFGTDDYRKLVGEKAYALFSFGEHNETIEGLESARTGRRFVHTTWARETFGKAESPLEREQHRTKMELRHIEYRRGELLRRLEALPAKFVDWSK